VTFNGYLWNLKAFIERLGLNQEEQPPLLNSVQPVLMMGDASKLTSNLYPAYAWAGGDQVAVAAQLTGFAIRSIAKGGTIIRSAHTSFTGGSTGAMAFSVSKTPHVFSGSVTVPLQQMGPKDCTAICKLGTTGGAPLGTDFPTINHNNWIVATECFYLPQGTEVYFEHNTVNLGVAFAFEIQDLDSQEP